MSLGGDDIIAQMAFEVRKAGVYVRLPPRPEPPPPQPAPAACSQPVKPVQGPARSHSKTPSSTPAAMKAASLFNKPSNGMGILPLKLPSISFKKRDASPSASASDDQANPSHRPSSSTNKPQARLETKGRSSTGGNKRQHREPVDTEEEIFGCSSDDGDNLDSDSDAVVNPYHRKANHQASSSSSSVNSNSDMSFDSSLESSGTLEAPVEPAPSKRLKLKLVSSELKIKTGDTFPSREAFQDRVREVAGVEGWKAHITGSLSETRGAATGGRPYVRMSCQPVTKRNICPYALTASLCDGEW